MTPEQPSDGEPNDPMIGRVLDGRYRILSRVARGGMASIFKAQDVRLDRVVAVKMMHPAMADDAAFVDRFVLEARSAARLAHPHVVQVHDQGNDSGVLYLVMEFIDGQTLRDLVREQAPMRPLAALTVLKPVLQALAAAHATGLVHRDVKPENVLISSTGTVKVADFGLAKAVTADTQHTATGGVLIGTVSYLAPELVVEGRIDPRVDVYAAGVLLYEMLTGVKPHDGETPIQIAWAHVHTDVPPPSALVPGLPDYVDALVARATARDRTLRPADASVLLRHVDRVGQALAEGVASDPELAGDLTPMALNPSTGKFVTTDTAPDPFDAADLAAIREPREVPDLPSDLGISPEPTRRFPVAGQFGPAPDATARVSVTPPVPAHGPQHTAIVPRDDIPMAPDPGTAAESRRARKARAKAARSHPPAAAPASPTSPAPRARRRWRGPVALVLAFLLAVGVGIGAWWFGWARYTETPGVVGLTSASATTKLDDAGLTVTLADPVFSEKVPAGTVVRSDPHSGERILRDGTVTLFVSKGQERYDVPDLAGKTQVEAEDLLRATHLEIDDVTHRWSETVDRDRVITSAPTAGTPMRRGDKVVLVLSKGRQPLKFKDWTGQDASAAREKLEKRFTVSLTEEHSDTVPKGRVISQTPPDGTLYRNDEIALVVSKGPVLVDVPNLRLQGTSEATATLEDLGFVVDYDRGYYVGLDIVYSQSPEGGTQAPKGSTITLSIS